MTKGQLAPFFTEIGKISGHGGWTKEMVDGTISQMEKIPVGESMSGNLHMDHKGQHEDVTMEVERKEKDRFTVRFVSTNEDLKREIASRYPKAKS